MWRRGRTKDEAIDPLLECSAFRDLGPVSSSPLVPLGVAAGVVRLGALGLQGVPFVHLDAWDQFETNATVEAMAAVAEERSVPLHYASLEADRFAESRVYEVPRGAEPRLCQYMGSDWVAARSCAVYLADLSLVFLDTDEDIGFIAGLPQLMEQFGSTARTAADYAARFPDFQAYRSPLLASFDPD